MAHGYRILQHWNQWLTQHYLGGRLLETEKKFFAKILDQQFGKHAVLLGVPHQYDLLNASVIPKHTLITPLLTKESNINLIEADLHELPILTGSVDVVLLPHTMEFVDHPRQLLAEACRIIKPEGLILICGFNPYSLWGLRKKFAKKHIAPWTNHFIHAHKVKSWLRLVDFSIEHHESMMYMPPIEQPSIYQRSELVEKIGSKLFPMLGGTYVILARAKVIPLTPIRLKWKQKLSSISISATIPGHIARRVK